MFLSNYIVHIMWDNSSDGVMSGTYYVEASSEPFAVLEALRQWQSANPTGRNLEHVTVIEAEID